MRRSSRSEDALVGALSHPTHRRILRILAARVASPREIAEEIDQPLGSVAHHVRWLARRRCIKLVRTVPRRGAVEHYYQALSHPLLTDEQWAELSSSRKASLAAAMLRHPGRDVIDANEAELLTQDGVHLSRTLLTVDDDGHRELSKLLLHTLTRAARDRGREQSTARRADGRQTELGVLHFERAIDHQ